MSFKQRGSANEKAGTRLNDTSTGDIASAGSFERAETSEMWRSSTTSEPVKERAAQQSQQAFGRPEERQTPAARPRLSGGLREE